MFSYQCSLLLPFHATAFILYQSISCLSTTFLFFVLHLKLHFSCISLFIITSVFLNVKHFFRLFSHFLDLYFTFNIMFYRLLLFSFEQNGERGIRTLAPLLTTYSLSRGAPSASLGTSPNCPTQSLLIFSEAFYLISRCFSFVKNFFELFSFSTAERVGFEPTRPCGQTVFKTASL